MALKTKLLPHLSTLAEAPTLTRLLIVSYFIALALNLIQGADIALLASPFLPDATAHLTMRCIVLMLSAMILFGVGRRPAALLLALIIFWPSYMAMYAGGNVSAFWRDLALIGALLMTSYEKSQRYAENGDDYGAEDHMLELSDGNIEAKKATVPFDDDVYREDLNLVRSA